MTSNLIQHDPGGHKAYAAAEKERRSSEAAHAHALFHRPAGHAELSGDLEPLSLDEADLAYFPLEAEAIRLSLPHATDPEPLRRRLDRIERHLAWVNAGVAPLDHKRQLAAVEKRYQAAIAEGDAAGASAADDEKQALVRRARIAADLQRSAPERAVKARADAEGKRANEEDAKLAKAKADAELAKTEAVIADALVALHVAVREYPARHGAHEPLEYAFGRACSAAAERVGCGGPSADAHLFQPISHAFATRSLMRRL